MTKEEFTAKLNRLKSVNSQNGNNYRDLSLNGERLIFRREKEYVNESIPIQELFDFYSSGRPLTIPNAQAFIPEEHQLPAVDILKALPTENQREEYHEFHSVTDKEKVKKESPAAAEFIEPSQDERRFFKVFSEIVGPSRLRSRSLGIAVTSSDIFLSNNYRDYDFPQEVLELYESIMEALLADGRFHSQSIEEYVDALLVGHPQLNNRIVTFDEEEHFTPARRDSLLILSGNLPYGFRDRYIALCGNLDYLRGEVFRKYDLNPETLAGLPETFARFNVWLQSSGETETAHLEENTPFGFGGGRIAQRAYYDCLLDTAHLSGKNSKLEPPLRFAKKSFEELAGIRFSGISEEEVKQIIIQVLKEDYKVLY